MQKPTERTLVIQRVIGVAKSRRGDPYVECETDAGVVAFWGGPREVSNIRKIQNAEAQVPFRVVCGCIAPSASYAKRHAFWVPQKPAISDPGPVAALRTPVVGALKATELVLPSSA
jgi:hypothetical protein